MALSAVSPLCSLGSPLVWCNMSRRGSVLRSYDSVSVFWCACTSGPSQMSFQWYTLFTPSLEGLEWEEHPSPNWDEALFPLESWPVLCEPLCVLSCFRGVWLFVTPWTVALQAPLSMGFSRQDYWSGMHALLMWNPQGYFTIMTSLYCQPMGRIFLRSTAWIWLHNAQKLGGPPAP